MGDVDGIHNQRLEDPIDNQERKRLQRLRYAGKKRETQMLVRREKQILERTEAKARAKALKEKQEAKILARTEARAKAQSSEVNCHNNRRFEDPIDKRELRRLQARLWYARKKKEKQEAEALNSNRRVHGSSSNSSAGPNGSESVNDMAAADGHDSERLNQTAQISEINRHTDESEVQSEKSEILQTVPYMLEPMFSDYAFTKEDLDRPLRYKKLPLLMNMKKTVPRDLQNENTNTMKGPVSLKENGPETECNMVSSPKRTEPNQVVKQSKSTNANGHLVYVRRKPEAESPNSNKYLSRVNNSHCSPLRKVVDQHQTTEEKLQSKEPSICNPQIVSMLPCPVACLPPGKPSVPSSDQCQETEEKMQSEELPIRNPQIVSTLMCPMTCLPSGKPPVPSSDQHQETEEKLQSEEPPICNPQIVSTLMCPMTCLPPGKASVPSSDQQQETEENMQSEEPPICNPHIVSTLMCPMTCLPPGKPSVPSSDQHQETEEKLHPEEPPLRNPQIVSMLMRPMTWLPSGKPSVPSTIGKSPNNVEEMGTESCDLSLSVTPSDHPKRMKIHHWEERYSQLQEFLEMLDQSNQENYVQMLRSLSSEDLSSQAVRLEKRSIQLSLEEAKELQRVQQLDVLGKHGKNSRAPTNE